tara:strand:- start:1496 stop:2752 length:1257 start_codon:yes stop_codon:yes gene_type:complete
MKNNNILVSINLMLITLSLLFSMLISGLGISYLLLGLFAIALYTYESKKLKSSLYDSMLLLVILPFLFIILFYGSEPFFLFVDDKNYFSDAKFEHLRPFSELIKSYFFELDFDFNNYLYLLSFYFKTFGYHQFVYFLINIICLIRIFSFISEARTEVKKKHIIRWIPLELILFSFFCFKDVLICLIVTEYVRRTFKSNFLIYSILSFFLVIMLEPLRVGYSFLFIFLIGIGKYTNIAKKLLRIPLLLSIWGLFVLIQFFLSSILVINNDNIIFKIFYYVDSLINRLDESSGFLSKFYESFNSGNIFTGILIVSFTVFIPILGLPDNYDNSDIIFLIFRAVTLLQYLLLLLSFKNLKNFRKTKYRSSLALIFISLTIIHLTFAPGMLRHSLIILPFLYSLLIHTQNENKTISVYRRSSL